MVYQYMFVDNFYRNWHRSLIFGAATHQPSYRSAATLNILGLIRTL